VAILGSSFTIGRSALASYQSALAVTGQNIANVGNPNYSRQSGHLSAVAGGNTLAGLSPGLGVNLDHIERHLDRSVETRLRIALGQRATAETTYQTLTRVEALYGELSDYDLSTQLSDLFETFMNVQTDPLESTSRDQVVASADAIIRSLQRHRSGLLTEGSDMNAVAVEMTREANAIAEEIAGLNELVVAAAARANGGDAALRDRRDTLLRDLSELVDIQVREHSSGVVNVYVGSEPLVDFGTSRGLETERVLDGGLERIEVRFADNGGPVTLSEGKLAGTIQVRDEHLRGQLDKIDQLARGLIYEVNRAHTNGRGLVGYQSVQGSYALGRSDVALNDFMAAAPFPIQNGTFNVHIKDQKTGLTVTRRIEVDLDGLNGDDTTLESLAASLNAVPNLSAQVTADNRLRLDSDPAFEFSFSEDSSGALAALGVGTFFEGTDATTIRVKSAIRQDPRLIASSANGAPGDGTNAGILAGVGDVASDVLGGRSVLEFHEAITNQLAVDTAAAETTYDANDIVYASLLAQRENVSGVSLDEEAINLTMYERAFQGASRYLNVVESLSEELLTLL
jgi:flagellar hook-associated protein 1 FlgK